MKRVFDPQRRHLVGAGLTALVCSAALPAFAAVPRVKKDTIRSLAFYNLHTDEKLHVDYWKNGKYDHAAMAKINHILRDHYSGDVFRMDVRLIDLVHDLQSRVGNHGPIDIISGYRSPTTNMRLARMTDGVASRSYHTKGMAMDIRLPGTPLASIQQAALVMDRGGVGYYPDSQFVHVDVGPVRRW